jgi:hypothetical protein
MAAVKIGLVLPVLILISIWIVIRHGLAIQNPYFASPSFFGLAGLLVVVLGFLGSIFLFARGMVVGKRRDRIGVAVVGGAWGLLMLTVGLYNAFGDAPFWSVRFWAILALLQAAAIAAAVVLMFRPNANAYFARGPAVPRSPELALAARTRDDTGPPLTLWKRLYLACASPDGLIPEGPEVGALVRAGVLAELFLTGEISDRQGRALLQRREAHPGALEHRIVAQISASPPLTWEKWIGGDVKMAGRVARDQLVDEGLVRAQRDSTLGVVDHTTYRTTDPALAAELRAAVADILRRAKAAEPDRDAVLRAAQDALSLLPMDARSLPRNQRRELFAEGRRRAEANLRAAYPHMNCGAIDDQEAAFVALAMRIPPYRMRYFQLTGEYAEQVTELSKRIEPIASALSRVQRRRMSVAFRLLNR